MFTLKRFISGSLFIVFLFSAAMAQETRTPIDAPQGPAAPISAGPLVTATATTERVRFVSPGTVVRLRLEVYNGAGEKLFDTELHGGNVLDWHLQDVTGQRLAAGSYACVLTTKSLSGRLSQRVGLVTITDEKTAVDAAGAAQLSVAQQQIIGPVEGNAAFTVLQDSKTESITAITHDGTDAQVTRTRGAFSFRFGDFFSGTDIEQMRLTAEGNLGIGTTRPKAKLDVAGMIRAREGFLFSNGSALNVNDKGGLTLTHSDGTLAPNVAGTGTTDRISKWTDNAGTLGDSALTEVGGNVGLGVASAGDLLDIAGAPNGAGRSGIHVSTTTSTGNATLYFDNDRGNFAAYGGLLTGGSSNASQFFGVTRADKTFLIADGTSSLGLGIGTLVPRPVLFGTANAERMRIDSVGNVGIGTSIPTQKLDVTGNINTSTGYYIGGSRVLSVAGTDNTFAGVNAGTSFQNTGTSNSFFGNLAGRANTSGFRNSFFGESAGLRNTTAEDSVFVGANAGQETTTGGDNVFVGSSAGFNNTTGRANSFFGSSAGGANTTGEFNTAIGHGANVGAGNLDHATAVGAGAIVSSSDTIALGRSGGNDLVRVPGILSLGTLGTAGANNLCRNASQQIAACSSSLRYKTHLNTYLGGLDVVRRLRPITFNWKDGGMSDVGFAAEEVEKIEPLLTTRNDKGEIEGVKYAQITTVLVNAVREQQQIIEQQQRQIEALKTFVCQQNLQAAVCKEK